MTVLQDSAIGKPDGQDIRAVAFHALSCGLCVIPPRQNGDKSPCVSEWKSYQTSATTGDDLFGWYGKSGKSRFTGIGSLCGATSGNLEVLEFDAGGEAYEAYKERAKKFGVDDIVERIEAGYSERTPTGGIHWLYRCETIEGNTALAKRFKTPEEFTQADHKAIAEAKAKNRVHRPTKILIETRGEGGYIVLAPSNGKVHPSGLPYELLRGDLATITTITSDEREALWSLARSFDDSEVEEDPESQPEAKARRANGPGQPYEVTPWEAFNESAKWEDLMPFGWSAVGRKGEGTYWRRPDKSIGVSAFTNNDGKDKLKVFTTSTELPNGRLSKYGLYLFLEHKGNITNANRALLANGFGKLKPKPEAQRNGAPAPPERPQIEDYDALTDEELGIVPLSSIEFKPIDWFWKYRMERGELTLTCGDVGIGKSQFLLMVGAAATVGGPLPDGSGNAPKGSVVIVAAEDSPEKTIGPRLSAMGADINMVTIIKAKVTIKKSGKPPVIHFMSFQDIAYWQAIFRRRPDCVLFIADPLPAFLGRGVNDSKNIEIRNILDPFIDEVITPANIAFLGNTHLNKNTSASTPIHRIIGSVAYSAIPRNIHFVAKDPDVPERRFVKQAKANDAPDNLPSLAFRVETRTVETPNGPIETAVPIFETETVADVDLHDIVNGGGKASGKRGPSPERTTKCAEWLFDYLSGRGPTALGAIFDAAGQAGFVGKKNSDGKWSNPATIYRASERIPELAGERSGKRIDAFEAPTGFKGKNVKHWNLVNADAAF